MTQSWHLGGRWFSAVPDLAPLTGQGVAWHLVREGNDGPRFLLQIWQPRPTDRQLDQLREMHLLRFQDAESLDPTVCRFGFSDSQVWFLQELQGTILSKLWPGLGRKQREDLKRRIQESLSRSPVSRLPHPDLLGVKSGRLIIPRVIGEAPWKREDLDEWYSLEAENTDSGIWLLDLAPELSEDVSRPIRGRNQELTYLKSLMFGLNAPSPMERITVLQGEEGLGKDQLCEYCAAAAETEDYWVANFQVQRGEKAGVFLGRVLKDLLRGVEADFYARHPDAARALARRLESFAFLRGGLNQGPSGRPMEQSELDASLVALEFAAEIHSRLVVVRCLESADPDLPEFLKDLVPRSKIPWILSCVPAAMVPAARAALGIIRSDAAASTVTLNRLEDSDLPGILEDLLGPNFLPAQYKNEVCRAGLGNPGLLRSILELAQLERTLVWSGTAWSLVPGVPMSVRVQEDLVGPILKGRIQRLSGLASAILGYLALADQALDLASLGRVLGVAGDPLDEAIHMVESTKLASTQGGNLCITDPRVKELVFNEITPSEVRRMARSFLRVLQDAGGKPVLSVRLQSFAYDQATALSGVMEVVEQETPSRPEDAERMVQQALQLNPPALQRARLLEFLSDSWRRGSWTPNQIVDPETGRSPREIALEALSLGLKALEDVPQEQYDEKTRLTARMLRKRAFLEIRLRQFSKASQSVQAAAECLVDHPLHPEQPRLRLALGKIHILGGYLPKGIKALEEGLQILGTVESQEGHGNQVALLLELGRAQSARGQFQRALSTLHSAQRLLEHNRDYRRLVRVLSALAQVHLLLGQTEASYAHLREALHAARIEDDVELQARCHLNIGIFRSCQYFLGPALSHLEDALSRFTRLGDRALITTARLWKARTLSALGDTVQAEFLMLKALGTPTDLLTAHEIGEHHFLQAEMAGFQAAWRDASRLYLIAADHCESSGNLWRERLARLRHIQAEANGVMGSGSRTQLGGAWMLLEQLKNAVDTAGSRWLDLEWHRAHALLLSDPEASETVASEVLLAWGEVLAAAREMRFPGAALEACSHCAELLLQRGEKLGARSRLQDAFASFQELWSWIPESHEMSFQGRKDIHRFRQAVESAGIRWVLPERCDPLVDWTPTQLSFSLANPHRTNS